MENPPVLTENPIKSIDYGMKLRPKLRKFALEYFKTGNGAQSYIDAGYSPNGARQSAFTLLTNTDLRLFLNQLQEETDAESKAIFSSVIRRTDEITRKAERGRLVLADGKPVMVDGKPVYAEDTASALKGLDQLSKLGGLYDKDAGKSKDLPQWTGIRINYGDGTLHLVTGTGPMPTQEGQKFLNEGPPKVEGG